MTGIGFTIIVSIGYFIGLLIFFKLIQMGNTLYEIRDLLKEGR
jgi:hypothetical protein